MNTKSVCLLWVLLIMGVTLHAQWVLEDKMTFSRSDCDEIISGVVADNGDCILVGYTRDDETQLISGIIYKYDTQGDTISKVIHEENSTMLFVKIVKFQKGYCVFGRVEREEDKHSSLLAFHLDSNLNIVKKKRYKLFNDTDKIWNVDALGTKDSGLLVSIVTSIYSCVEPTSALYKLSSTLNLEKSVFFSPNSTEKSINDIKYNSDSTRLIGFGTDWSSSIDISAITFNLETLNVEKEVVLSGTKWADASSYNCCLIAPNQWLGCYGLHVPEPYERTHMYTALYDSSFNLVKRKDVECETDTFFTAAVYNSIDCMYPNRVYFGGMKNKYISYLNRPTWCVVGITDNTLNDIDVLYYGGDSYYKVSSIMATADGGCLVMGADYNLEQNSDFGDFFVMKLNYNGWGVPKADDLCIQNRVNVFPNPGSDFLQVTTTLNKPCFELFNATGSVVFSEALQSNKNTIFTRHLPAGHYTWRLYNQKQSESGIWIKK